MGNNYDFKFNPERLSSERIEKHKDFDALLEKYQHEQTSKPGRSARIRRLAYIGSAVAAGIAILWLVIGVNPTGRPTDPSAAAEAYFAAQPYVNPPVEEVQPAFASYAVNAQSGGEIFYTGGSKMVVPRQAFVNDRGQNVQGEVDIRFRKLTDYVDFFLAGIPMTYDSAGVRYHLESAGMLEIYAEQNGQPVQLAPGKTIEVALFSEILVSSPNEKPSFNVYKLDTAARRWVYYSPDQIEFLDDLSYDENDPLAEPKQELVARLGDIEQKKKAALTELEASIPLPEKPLRPFPNDPNIPTFELDFPADVSDSEAAALHAETVWQLSPDNAPFDQGLLAYAWDVESIEKINDQEYEIVLTKPDYTLRILASPVLIGEDYERALARYQEDLATYDDAMAERDRELRTLRQSVETWEAEERQAAVDQYEAALADRTFVNTSPSSAFRRRVVNRFAVDQLGIWNCDRPVRPDKEQVMAVLKDQKGNTYRNLTAYVVDKTHNTLYRYYAAEGLPLALEKDAKNLIWVVTEDQKVARLQTDPADAPAGEMTLTLVEETIRSEADARRVLAFN